MSSVAIIYDCAYPPEEMPGDFVKNQIGHSDLRITSNYTHFEHRQKREMVEKLLSCTQNEEVYLVADQAKAS
jgi:hypothetical protein